MKSKLRIRVAPRRRIKEERRQRLRQNRLQSRPAPAPPAPPPPPPPPNSAGLKKILLIGINYVGSRYSLNGCINDVLNMEQHLKTHYPECTQYKMLTDNTPVKPSKHNVLDALAWLTNGLVAGDNIYFHYSGHGGRIRDKNGDEVSGYDSCIYPFANGNIEELTDDEIRVHLVNKVPEGCKCFVVFDACHSGSVADLRYLWQSPKSGTLVFTEDKNHPKSNGLVLMLSGCKDDEPSIDTVSPSGQPCGALTMALLDTWRKYGSSIKTKYLLWDIRKFLKDNNYSQMPQLSTGCYYDLNQIFDLKK